MSPEFLGYNLNQICPRCGASSVDVGKTLCLACEHAEDVLCASAKGYDYGYAAGYQSGYADALSTEDD